MSGELPRRRVLGVALGAGLGVGGLAACTPQGGASAGTAQTTPGPVRTGSGSATDTPSAPSATFRFATASDGHLGQPGTDSRRNLAEFVAAVNRVHAGSPIGFVVVNGDIGHGGLALQREAKRRLDALDVPYVATQGNHDRVGPADWQDVWGTPGNVVQRLGDRSIVCANTSNLAGDFLCADASWLKQALAGEAGQRDVFVFMHITPNTWTRYGIACPAVRHTLADAPNVRAVFNGHDHDQTGVKVDEGVHYVFDAHYGGSWGTSYRAFRMVEVDGTRLTTWLVKTTGEKLPATTISW